MTTLRFLVLSLLLFGTAAHAAFDTWEGSTPFATGLGNQVITALAVSPDGMTAYAGTGSGTVLRYVYSVTTYTATPSSGGNGSIAPNTVQTVNQGATTSFTLTPDAGYHIGSVGGTCGGNLAGSTFTTAAVIANCTVVANFTLNTYAITVSAGTGGTASCTPNPVSHGNSSTCTATPGAGYSFTGWSGDCSGTTCILSNVTSARSVTASFALNSYAFSFTAQTGAALSSVATSNTITVAGINSAANIGIAGGSYSINGGVYTTAAGTVNNGDTVTVRQTASASYGTTTTATLTIGGVSGVFNVTTLADPAVTTSYTAPSATATGNITASFTGGGPGCGYTVSQFIPLTGHGASPPTGTAPAGVSFPHGLFDFTTGGCTPGSTITLVITYPQALPAGTVYWKYGPTPTDGSYHWYQLPAMIAGNTATFSITDGGLGDDDLAANGTIVDQGGPGGGGGVASIPTLSEWALLMLAGLMGLFGMGAMRRRPA